MAEKLFAPLDQYEPFVDEDGRITPQWYSWLMLLCDELNRLNTIPAVRRRGPNSSLYGPEPASGGLDG